MFEAQLLIGGDTGEDVRSVYSPWFARGGDYMIATVEVVQISADITLETTVFTKNSEDTTDGAVVDAAIVIAQTAVGRMDDQWNATTGTGLKELVRYRFTTTTGLEASSLQWVLFRVLPPVWFNATRG